MATREVYEAVKRFGRIGELDLRAEMETCGWDWPEVDRAIDALCDMAEEGEIEFRVGLGKDAVGRWEPEYAA